LQTAVLKGPAALLGHEAVERNSVLRELWRLLQPRSLRLVSCSTDTGSGR
jgi:hypothetical protein